MKFILGQKLGMTQVFREDGTVVPVTRIKAGPCTVTQVKDGKKDGFHAVQVGYGSQKVFRLTRAEQGHLKGLGDGKATVRVLKEMPFEEGHGLERGGVFTVSIFDVGEKVHIIGTSRGRGFQGVVKRHGFHGSPATHGHKDQERMPGSIGATDAARVFKGTRMGGHMGNQQVTVRNLEVIEVHPDSNEILVKGAVPGARNSLVILFTPEGKIEIVQVTAEESQVEEVAVENTEKIAEEPTSEEPTAEEEAPKPEQAKEQTVE